MSPVGARKSVLSPRGLRSSARTSWIAGGRLSAALTALAFALSTLIGLVHEATTRHVQCAEHGEQIHSDAATPLAQRAPANSLQQQTGGAVHGHEHCLIAAASGASRITPSAPAIAAVAAHAAALAAAPPDQALAPPRHVYLTAPKTSPPA